MTTNDQVDKYWPVAQKADIKTEIKEEPIDIDDEDPDWEREAEEEILAANEGYFDTSPTPVIKTKIVKERPKRVRAKTKSYKEDPGSDPDDPEQDDDDDVGSLFGDYHVNNNEDDPDFEDEEDDDDDSFTMDMFVDSEESNMETDESHLDLSLVKEEVDNIDDDGEESSKADRLLASSQECKIVEIGGFKVETYGDYSKCPKCLKNIKSTFIIRHIKLHDVNLSMDCPHQGCSTSFTRSNNMYRHLKVINQLTVTN